MAYEHRFYVGLSSVDRAGVLFYAELFRHAHDAYEAFMASLGEALAGTFDRDRYTIPIAHAEADYDRPLRHGETVIVQLRVERLGHSSFTLTCDFLGPEGALRARTRTVHVFVDRHPGRPVPLPNGLRKKLEALLV